MQTGAVWFKRLSLLSLIGVVMVAVVTIRVLLDGERAMKASDSAFDRGELRDAVAYAREAAIQYAPGAPHVTVAYERLKAVAIGAEAHGQPEIAELAWTAIRGAVLETRHLWTHHSAELRLANENLARLAAGKAPEVDRDEARERADLALSRDESPRIVWILLLATGLCLTALGLLLVVARGIGADGRLSRAPVRWGLALSLLGAALWAMAVYRA